MEGVYDDDDAEWGRLEPGVKSCVGTRGVWRGESFPASASEGVGLVALRGKGANLLVRSARGLTGAEREVNNTSGNRRLRGSLRNISFIGRGGQRLTFSKAVLNLK